MIWAPGLLLGSFSFQGWVVAAAEVNSNVRYEPEEVHPHQIAVGLGVQAGVITLPAIVIGVVIVVRAAGASDSYLAWAAFAVLLVSGLTTLIQAVRFGKYRVGAHPDHGDVGGVLRGVHRCAAGERAGHDGEPDRRIVAVPVPAGGQAVAAAADLHAGGVGVGDHADHGHRAAGRPRRDSSNSTLNCIHCRQLHR